jgi:hypothetical protein
MKRPGKRGVDNSFPFSISVAFFTILGIGVIDLARFIATVIFLSTAIITGNCFARTIQRAWARGCARTGTIEGRPNGWRNGQKFPQ